MTHRWRSGSTKRHRRYSGRLRDLEARLEAAERRLVRLENTLEGIAREVDEISLGGPCTCGESLVIVRKRTMYCPRCRYTRTI